MRIRLPKQFVAYTLLLVGGLFFSFLIAQSLNLLITPAHALEVGVSEVEETIALSGTDIRIIIARIIRVALGLLGAIAVLIVLYGGFLWMTAGGEEDKVTQAKRVLTNGVIGLVIILTSFAITQFVLSRLVAATTGGIVAVDDGGAGSGGGLSANAFVVRSIAPQNPAPQRGFPMNSVVRIRMSQAVDEATLGENLVVHPTDSDTPLAGAMKLQGSLIRFIPDGSCAPFSGSNCFSQDTVIEIEIRAGLRSASGRSVVCGGLAPNCSAKFLVGAYLDTEDPTVGVTVPAPGQSIPPDFLMLRAGAADDVAVAEVEFFDTGTSVGTDAPPSDTASFEASAIWETSSLPVINECRSITASATDVAENLATSSAVPVVVRPGHCFNGVQDAVETGVDCGGDLENNASDYCGQCAGEACDNEPEDACNLFCRSGSCVGGVCVDRPRIDDFSPRAAHPGSLITITGEFLGSAGSVIFLGGEGTEDDRVATVQHCEGAWTSTQVVVAVPERALEGPLALTTAVGTDTTSDDQGVVDNFSPAGPLLPGLCPIVPAEGVIDSPITLRGFGFGNEQLDSAVIVGSSEARVVTSWGPEEIRAQVPPTASGRRTVTVTVSGQESNAVNFTVLGPEAGLPPSIDFIRPAVGSPGTYLTIFGSNFGETGQVIFKNPITGAMALGDIDFPEVCVNNFWEQSQITVKVPEEYYSGVGTGGSNSTEDLDLDGALGPDCGSGNVPAWTADSVLGRALLFDGNDDEVSFERTALINPGRGSFSVSLWVKPGGRQASQTGLIGRESDDDYFIFELTSDNRMYYEIKDKSGRGNGDRGSRALTTDNWNHLVNVINRENNSIDLYLNGELDRSIPVLIENLAPDGVFKIGRHVRTLNGAIDEINIFGRALSANEVAELYNLRDLDEAGIFAITFDEDAGCSLAGQISHEIMVRRSGISEASSISKNFNIIPGTPAPGLCAMSPVSGPVGIPVQFFGEGFGNAATTAVRFFENVFVRPGPSFASSEGVRAVVPEAATTGPVTLEVSTAVGGRNPTGASNPRNFQVIDCREDQGVCETGYECCASGACALNGQCFETARGAYAWYISTGSVPRLPRLVYACGENSTPSPAPYSARSGGEEVCVNALITGRFSVPMEANTINAGSVLLLSCVDDGGDLSCLGEEPARVATFPWNDGESRGHGFTLTPEELLPDTWYEVRLLTSITGEAAGGRVPLETNPSCAPGTAYCWRFKTRETAELCALDGLSVEPRNYVINVAGDAGRVVYTALGETDEDFCLRIDTRPYDFAWSASAPDGFATISEGVPEGFSGFELYEEDDRAVAAPVLETPAGNPVDIRAVARTDESALVDGLALLTIDYTDPEVVEYAPNCTEACINAKLVLRFNTDMSGAPLAYSVLDSSAFQLWQCFNESCIFPATQITFASPSLNVAANQAGIPPGHILEVVPQTNLLPHTYYRWILRGWVQSRSGVSLVGENFGADYSQIFRTKNDATPCDVSSVELNPAEATVRVVGARVPFSAIPRSLPDACSAEGQELASADYDWLWATADSNVANYLVSGVLRDTNTDTEAGFPLACSSQCLNTGAVGVFGRVAVCGNGSACTADVECESGEVCSRFGQCIEAVLGEECDDGNTDDGDGCSKICTNEGSVGNRLCSNGGACVPTVVGHCGDRTGAVCARDADCEGDTPCVADCGAGEYCDFGSLTCVEYGEDCDDGNTANNDGCSAICVSEGARSSSFGGTTCGNNVIDLGEDCDDGNRRSDDGCSSSCLADGSAPGPLAICGNGDIEIGEECDGGENCDRATCLHTGTPACSPPYPVDGLADCCGNGDEETGEDCDDGNEENGDGCSARCLYEGSSPFYETPSFCGDGAFGAGEECEATGGDGKIDSFQVAEAVGQGVVTNGRQSTTLTAGTSTTITDTASFTLQCGFTNDNQCLDPATGVSAPIIYGVGSDSCCYQRTLPNFTVPSHNNENVCRNPLIRVDFSKKMDLGSFTGHLLLARATAREVCAPGEEEMTGTRPAPPAGVPVGQPLSFWSRTWERFWSFLSPFDEVLAAPLPPSAPRLQPAADDGAWCLGSATGRVSGVHHENDPDISSDDRSSLIFTLESGALDPDTWYRVRVVGDREVTDDTIQGVRSANGVGMYGNYEFSFLTGRDICTVDQVVVSDQSGVELFTRAGEEHPFEAEAYSYRGGLLDPIVPVAGVYDWSWRTWTSADSSIVTVPNYAASSVNPNTATVRADGKNGTTAVGTSLAITTDLLSIESAAGRPVSGNKQVEVFLCENLGLEVADVLRNEAEFLPPHGNFRTRYCRDAGAPGAANDLSMMRVQTVPQPPGITFKEFLLRYVNPVAAGNDAIGFRILPNPNHFSAARWYASQGFSGTPQALTVDGYDAVRLDRTVYIHAANSNDDILYDNIYVVSVNESARPEAVNIFEQLLANLVFNQNLIALNTNLCAPVAVGAAPTNCSSDFDCDDGAICQAPKDKLRRDTRRLADLRDIEAVLARRCAGGGCSYPTLSAGTFVRARSNSAWPSWLETLSADLGAILPTDPLNRFANCPTGYDGSTCFAAAAAVGCPNGTCYQCPAGSHIYEYVSRAPNEYRLAADLEYSNNPFDNPWETSLAAFPSNVGATLVAGGAPYCRGTVIGNSNVCGDSVVGPAEVCERGQTGVRACAAPGGPGRIASICNNTCTGFVDQPGASCIAEFCGDGVIQSGESCDDGSNNGFYGFCNAACSGSAAYCGDETLAGAEQCDLGAMNGQWKQDPGTPASPLSCAWDCSFPGPYCGDREVNGAEVCDSQEARGPGRCSNEIQRPCATDGDCSTGGNCTLLCAASNRCSSDVTEYCAVLGATCDGGRGVCTEYPGERVRACNMAGATACRWAPLSTCQIVGTGCGDGIVQGTEQCEDNNDVNTDACTDVCRWNVCGDGFLFEGVEQCDSGLSNGTPCAAPYGGTCNYCSPTCTFVTQTGGFCGDGSIADTEICDGSADPIVRVPWPKDYLAGTSLCNNSCAALCPSNFDNAAVRFQNPSPSTSYTFVDSETDINQLAIPACRLGGNLTVDTSFSADVIHFPSPMDVLLVLDNSGSMVATDGTGESRIQRMHRALCGESQPNCDELTSDGAVAQLLGSRDLGDVRVGILEFGGTSRFRTWNFGNQTNVDENNSGESPDECEPTDPVPCYDRGQYLGADNRRGTRDDREPLSSAAGASGVVSTFASGFLADDGSGVNRNKLRAVVQSLGAENGGTRAFLALRQAKAIMDGSRAASKVVIFMSDGVSTDCCSGGWPANNCSTTAGGTPLIERNQCGEEATCVGPSNRCNTGFGRVQDLDCEEIDCGGPRTSQCLGGSRNNKACFTNNDCSGYESGIRCDTIDGCVGGPRAGTACDSITDCVNSSISAGCRARVNNCCSTGPVSCTVTGGELNDCQFSDVEAAAMSNLDDDIYVFTVSFPNVIAPMERWADHAPGGNPNFSYAGINASQMFDNILSNIGVRVQISNNDSFSDDNRTKWMDEITIPESDFAVPLLTPELNQRCTDTWQQVFIRTIYGRTSADATVTLREPRWNYCPRVLF